MVTPSPVTPAEPGSTPVEFQNLSSGLTRRWWPPLVRGVVMALVALLGLLEPLTASLGTVRWLLVAVLVADVLVLQLLWWAYVGTPVRVWWQVQAVVDVVIAIILAAWGTATTVVVYYVISAWALALGIIIVVTASVAWRAKDVAGPWILTGGLTSLLVGAILIVRPAQQSPDLADVVLAVELLAVVAAAVYVMWAFGIRAVAVEVDAALAGSSPALEALRASQAELAARKAQDRATREAEKAARDAQKAAEREAKKSDRPAE